MSLNGISQHYRPGVPPVSPPDDDGVADFCSDMLITGEHILTRRPGCLMAIIADAPREFDGAKAELLAALFGNPVAQTKSVRKLAEWMRQDSGAQELTFDVLADMASESQPDYSED